MTLDVFAAYGRFTVRKDKAHKALGRSQRGQGRSITRGIKNTYQSFNTCVELIDWIEAEPPPKLNRERMKTFKASRGKRSKRAF